MHTTLPSHPYHQPAPWPRRYHFGVVTNPRSTTLGDLDAAFASGAAQLREAYDAHGALVYSICRKALDEHAAKDVTQDVFVSAWRGRHQFDPQRGTLAGWLVGITKRRIIDHLRSERRHADRRADALHDAPDHHAEPEVERSVDQMLVVEALRHLPERSREMIELAYVHDLTHHAIAERTGVPLGTVKSDIRRGLLRIREHLESNQMESTNA
jgi:RNA polymerase sigma-70 factor (ECF subfamily)